MEGQGRGGERKGGRKGRERGRVIPVYSPLQAMNVSIPYVTDYTVSTGFQYFQDRSARVEVSMVLVLNIYRNSVSRSKTF